LEDWGGKRVWGRFDRRVLEGGSLKGNSLITKRSCYKKGAAEFYKRVDWEKGHF